MTSATSKVPVNDVISQSGAESAQSQCSTLNTTASSKSFDHVLSASFEWETEPNLAKVQEYEQRYFMNDPSHKFLSESLIKQTSNRDKDSSGEQPDSQVIYVKQIHKCILYSNIFLTFSVLTTVMSS